MSQTVQTSASKVSSRPSVPRKAQVTPIAEKPSPPDQATLSHEKPASRANPGLS